CRADVPHINVVIVSEWRRDSNNVCIRVYVGAGGAEVARLDCLVEFFVNIRFDDGDFAAVDALDVCLIYIDTRNVDSGVGHNYGGWKADVSETDEGNGWVRHFLGSSILDNHGQNTVRQMHAELSK